MKKEATNFAKYCKKSSTQLGIPDVIEGFVKEVKDTDRQSSKRIK